MIRLADNVDLVAHITVEVVPNVSLPDVRAVLEAVDVHLVASRATPQTLDGATVEACVQAVEATCSPRDDVATIREAVRRIRALSPRTDGPHATGPEAFDTALANATKALEGMGNGRFDKDRPAPSATQGVSARPAREVAQDFVKATARCDLHAPTCAACVRWVGAVTGLLEADRATRTTGVPIQLVRACLTNGGKDLVALVDWMRAYDATRTTKETP